MPQPNRFCNICGSSFYASPGHIKSGWGKYCGLACRTKGTGGRNHPNWKEDEGKCECPQCGKEYHQKPSKIKKGNARKFCSESCRFEAENSHKSNVVTVKCRVCGMPHKAIQWDTGEISPEWCSYKCQKAEGRPRTVYKCITCEKEFHRKKCRKKGAGSFCSNACKHSFMSSHATSISGRPRVGIRYGSGRRPDLGEAHFRSRWEANYARYLNLLISQGVIRSWEFEPDVFKFPVKRGTKIYTPDFKVITADGGLEYHEVKGWMSPKSILKLKRMRIHHKDVKIVVIDSKSYKELARSLGKTIPGWEPNKNGQIDG